MITVLGFALANLVADLFYAYLKPRIRLEYGKETVSDPFMKLADYRRRVAQMYAALLQSAGDPEQAWQSYRV